MDDRLRRNLLAGVYGEAEAASVAAALERMVARFRSRDRPRVRPWSERDVWLISYPDQFASEGESTLATLGRLLDDWEWLTGVHVLPCYPWTSDDGFSVLDYHSIEPSYGDWEDITRLASDGRHVMLDAVINHMSSESAWFEGYLRGDPARAGFFIEQEPDADYRDVVRPRTSPLFHPFRGHDGTRQIWTTFSADQVDLNYANPDVLEAVAEVLLTYCARGATALRLDAIGFMWKQAGTSSIHLRQTHDLIAVLGSVVREAFPGTIVVSEVNVPHAENVAYLGTSDRPESDLIYQFSLAPLTLSAVLTGDCDPLVQWANDLDLPRSGVSFLNFLASHDGVGVRPAEGLVEDLTPLLDATDRAGGQVSYRQLPDGDLAPYELNSTWFDLVADGGSNGMERHLATHAVMMAMPGIPLLYVHSLFGSPNDHDLFRHTGRARSLNRHKFSDAESVRQRISSNQNREGRVFSQIRTMARWRSGHPAFHPEAGHRVSEIAPGVVRIDRFTDHEHAAVIANLTGESHALDLVAAAPLDGGPQDVGVIGPWEHRWVALG